MLGQNDHLSALAQGMVIGPALWGLTINFVLHVVPGLAGTLAVWLVVLAVSVWLVRRSPSKLRVPLRTVAGFAGAALALFWVALASRQVLGEPDLIHLQLAASIRAGEWPPVIPWNPGVSVPYHYGLDILIGLLTPAVGPDAAFTTEVLGSYAWSSLVLIVASTLIRHGRRPSVLLLALLLLTPGAWTLFSFNEPADILAVPVPLGLPSTGIRESLASVYWPSAESAFSTVVEAAPPNIWKPSFVLAYSLMFVVLERVAASPRISWIRTLTLAGLIAFLGLVDETIAAIGLALWIVLDSWRLLRLARGGRYDSLEVACVAGGFAAAALLLAIGGGVITGVLTGAAGQDISLSWLADPGSRRPIGSLQQLSGGLGLLGLNVVSVAFAATLVGWRNQLALSLAAASGFFLLGALVVHYESSPDIVRLDGHARNLALLAFLVGLSGWMSSIPARCSHAILGVILIVVIWPTTIQPIRTIVRSVGTGVEIANARPGREEFPVGFMGRSEIKRFRSEAVATYIREETPVDARVLSPTPNAMTLATGRPNASGFTAFIHLSPGTGPEYHDAIRYLEPAALRRLGVGYVHLTDAWAARLPSRARVRLDDPRFFEPLVRDGPDSLFRVRAAFLGLRSAPFAETFEALRQAIPSAAVAYLSTEAAPLDALRAAATMSHAHLRGVAPTAHLHPLTRLRTTPLGSADPDLVVAPTMLLPDGSGPIWWNESVAVYSPNGEVPPLLPLPDPPASSVTLSDVYESESRVAFTATFENRTEERWTSQDWVVLDAEASHWNLLLSLEGGRGTPWFAGQIKPGADTTSFSYEFDGRAAMLSVRNPDGTLTSIPSSTHPRDAGSWTLAIRLRDEHRRAHLFPVLEFEILADGSVRYEVDGVGR